MWVELGRGRGGLMLCGLYVWPFSGILGGLGAERWVECGWSWVEGG